MSEAAGPSGSAEPPRAGEQSPPPPPGGGYRSPPPAGSGYGAPPPPSGSGFPAPPPPAHGYGAGYGQQPGGSQLSQQDERLWAVLAHLGGFVLGLLAPLVVMLVQGDKSPFVRRHAVEALNFQITVLIAAVASTVLMIVLIGFLLIFAVVTAWVVLMVLAAIKANNGEDYRYPMTIRLVK